MVDDRLEPADAILVLSGDAERERLDTALALARRGLAERIVVLTGTPPSFYDESSVIRAYAGRTGIAPGRVIVIGQAHSTLDDARITAGVMRAHGWSRAIIVTAPYHTRRARWVFRRVWGPLGLSVAVHPASGPAFDPGRWWADQHSAEAVALEYVKLAVYAVRFVIH